MKISDTIPHDLLVEGIAANSTAELDLSGEKPSVIGNPTEGALLLWLHDQGADYRKIRDSLTTIDELPFTTERKYMATAVSNASGRRMLYVKGHRRSCSVCRMTLVAHRAQRSTESCLNSKTRACAHSDLPANRLMTAKTP